MQWLPAAVLLFSFVCKALSSEAEDGEPALQIMAKSAIYSVGEIKAIYCNYSGLIERLEWETPTGKIVKEKSSNNKRVYIERKPHLNMVALLIRYVNTSDSGTWTCKAGNLSDKIEFVVGVKVNITERLVTAESEEGKSIKLVCNATGEPAPVVAWYKDNNTPITALGDKEKYVIRENPHSLEIKKLKHTDAATYVCKIWQKLLSHYTDKVFKVSVKHKPILWDRQTQAVYTMKTEEVYAIMNETKNITCSAIANPSPTYAWTRFDKNFDTDIDKLDMVVDAEDGTSSVLMLRVRDESSLGEYKCTAKNDKGHQSIVFHVTLGTRPNQPDSVELVSANVTELTFNVTCSTCNLQMNKGVQAQDPRNLTVLGYSFQLVPVKPDYPVDWDGVPDILVDIEDPEDTLFVVGPLDNNTLFHARVRSRNAAGYSEWVPITPDPRTISHSVRIIGTFFLIIAAFVFTRCY